MSNELENLNVGDLFAISYGYGSFRLARVERVTPTQVIVGTERFHKKNGSKVGVGSSWNPVRAFIPSAQKLKEIRRTLLEKSITSAWSKSKEYSDETVEQIGKLLNVKLEY
jgi:hypothetical protein